jgi:tRNA pseudouridine55 synthase
MMGRSSGVLVVDKDAGLTSFQVVARLKRALRPTRIGHGGTLDPAATGVLPVLIGEATKLNPYLIDHDKEYLATVRLGITTDTQDLTGRVQTTAAVPALTREEIEQACGRLTGVIRQVPPMYSAVRRDGRRLYELARAGLWVERVPREVSVHSLTVEAVELPMIRLRIVCGKGTYVRALAADLGAALGPGGALEHLRRTRVGPFTLSDAVSWRDVCEAEPAELWARVRPPDAGIPSYPEVSLDAPATEALRHGQIVGTAVPYAEGSAVRVYDTGRSFIGIGRVVAGGRLKPERLLHADLPGSSVRPA